MRAYISGMAYRVGRRVDIADLFQASSESGPPLEFYLGRGLKNYCLQEEITGDLYRSVVESTLENAGIGAGDVGAVISTPPRPHGRLEKSFTSSRAWRTRVWAMFR